MKRDVCVIVDGFSTGKLLAPILNEKGFSCIHVITSEDTYRKHLEENKERYIKTLFLEKSLDNLVNQLKDYKIQCIIPGIEGDSIIIADKLNHIFKLSENTLELSEARRNKFLMCKALQENNINTIQSIKVTSEKELIKQHKKIENFPKVIKPEASGASQDVHICHDENSLIKGFKQAIGKLNPCGVTNDAMLIQPYITGKEYFINTVSCDGRHYITDIWVYLKKLNDNNEPICHGSELLERRGEAQNIIAPYIFKVLDALGVKKGPAHIELIIHDNQPFFIELGARLMGGAIDNKIFQNSLGYSQLDATIDCYTNPHEFYEKIKDDYKLRKHLEFINVNAEQSGAVKFTSPEKILSNLQSLEKVTWLIKDGDQVTKTKDDYSSIGLIILQHENTDIIKQEAKFINQHLDEIFIIK